ncbi:MAG: NAD(P)-dependent oxidoreductase [Sphaerochaetaceae bacterium]|nr:NAD(P)-dependent oxidoreductase [Sphaerochaetaceae bacterium]
MWTKEKLDEILSEPSERLIADLAKLDGDIMILGAGGKMGPTMSVLAANAIKKGGLNKKVYAVSRFSDEKARKSMEDKGVITISADLQDSNAVAKLPDVKNIVFMAGRKFGTDGSEALTWGMNAAVPVLVCEKFTNSNFVVFSSGNIYDLVEPSSGGSLETDKVHPIGEYTQSCLARERVFEFYAKTRGIKVLLFRLNYAIALEYGVISDIAKKVVEEKPIRVENACFNCIWQGDANEFALRSLLVASELDKDNPVKILNVTGPEIAGVKATALKLASKLGKKVSFEGEPCATSYLSNAGEAIARFGYPSVSLDQMIDYQAQWIKDGGYYINKPTHFEERKGSY